MKKLLKQLLSRTFLMVLAILAQVAVLILMILEFSSYFVGFYAVCTLGSLVAVLWIVNSERNPAYKLAWVIPIMLFPIFGGLFFLLFGTNKSNRKIRRSV
ncbi:MAG TPA: cardiolipin synthase, partial [Ruminococcaceae bacterium]|nr:cardiolipin synthase [Oscillospiraceae bacterium]